MIERTLPQASEYLLARPSQRRSRLEDRMSPHTPGRDPIGEPLRLLVGRPSNMMRHLGNSLQLRSRSHLPSTALPLAPLAPRLVRLGPQAHVVARGPASQPPAPQLHGSFRE